MSRNIPGESTAPVDGTSKKNTGRYKSTQHDLRFDRAGEELNGREGQCNHCLRIVSVFSPPAQKRRLVDLHFFSA